MMFCHRPLVLVRSTAVTPTLLALIVMLMVPPLSPAMELKIVGNQIILSGPVVGDEPEKVREALASSPSIDTVILRNSPGGNAPAMAPPVGSGAPSGCSWACWKRLTAGQMLPLCSYGEQMENRSADVADGVRRSVSRPGGVRPLPRREAVAGWFRLSCLRRLQGLGARDQAVHLGVFRLPPADLGDRRYGHASEQVAAADVVRGDPPAGEPFERHFRRAGAGAIRHRQLQDGLAAAAQAAPGDGIAG